jgi:adenylate kinase
MYVVLLGAPGAGKGTQADILKERTGMAHIATGDMFRENVREGTELGTLAKSYMDKGELVPDEVTIRMLVERLQRPDVAKGVMFDGFPRNLEQAIALDEALAAQGRRIDKALYIEVPDEELVQRLSSRWMCRQCGAIYNAISDPPKQPGVCDRCQGELYQRDDDKPETVRRRLEVMKPPASMVEHYAAAGKLRRVDGLRSVDEVTVALLAEIEG